MVVLQNEQILVFVLVMEFEDIVDYRSVLGFLVLNDVSELFLLQFFENEVEDVGIDREIDFVVC